MNTSPNIMLKQILLSTVAAITLVAAASAAPSRTDAAVQTQIDWPAFIARQDMVWDSLPKNFDCGAFLGNGMLGATIYQDGDNRLRFEMGRSDVTEHRRDNARLPIGGLVLKTVGKIQSGTMRLELWNAEVRGTVKSLAGEPCRVQAVFASTPKLRINGKAVPLQPATNGIFDLPLKKDDEALLFTGESASVMVTPVPMAVEEANLWGGGKRLSDLNKSIHE